MRKSLLLLITGSAIIGSVVILIALTTGPKRAPSHSQATTASRPEADPLRVGETAPDFTLTGAEDGRPVRLYDLLEDSPVVLIFGSFT